ncbi:hypothetical protein P43SY_009486 [Pythium insidiosum]|uniref:Uncharacterized protein n=1 Tax=Pythium insidiosum TaxID=114742 RepID=A0AAD5LAA7_PYTIN|nr:hypothetical protein P43SY_009486 [Pythium insidiosum]
MTPHTHDDRLPSVKTPRRENASTAQANTELFALVCEVCAAQCALSARFCAQCGAKATPVKFVIESLDQDLRSMDELFKWFNGTKWSLIIGTDADTQQQTTGDLELVFPIQHREARMLAYRSYAILYGFLSVRILHDYSMKIVYLNARTTQTMTLVLTEKAIVRCLGDGIRDQLTSSMSRRVVYERVCEKLFVEYTSRGYELLFPGISPKGAARRHPMEVAVMQDTADYLEREQRRLREAMEQCIAQTVTIARRRMDDYLSRMKRLRKERQEQAARKIQSRTRGLMAKRRLRRQREDQRRASRVQNLAASLIQQRYRQNQDMERQRRLRAVERYNQTGSRFRLACRIHQSFMLATVTLDEIDVATNGFDCLVHVVHPVTSQTAQLRVSHSTLQRLLGPDARSKSRRQIVDALLLQHLDVFRSAQALRQVLVLGLRNDM